MIRKNIMLFAAFVAVTLVMPMMAGSSNSAPVLVSSSHAVSSDGPQVGTIEVMGTKVDAWGGVYNIIASFQNATHYGLSHVDALEDVVTGQMTTDDGYVQSGTFAFLGLVPYPNGAVGGPTATLQLTVMPVIEVPATRADVDFADLSAEEAITIADEYVAIYETALGINMERLLTVEMPIITYFNYGMDSKEISANTYQMNYIALVDTTTGTAAMEDFLDILSDMGGFMNIVSGADWPLLWTQTTEQYSATHWLEHYYDPGFFVGALLGSPMPYIRAHASHTDLVETVQSGVFAEVAFQEPGQVDAVAGDETYSLANHVGYTDNIVNKMYEDPTAISISIVGGVAPGPLDIVGMPSDWLVADDQFEIPEEVEIPGFGSLPENTTISEIITTYLSHMPREFALMANDAMTGLDPTILDGAIDSFWGSITAYPDFRQQILSIDFSTDFPETQIKEINGDLLALLMAQMGMNPDALMSRVDATLLAENPAAAIVEAFINYFDAYGILHILDNDNYGTPDALEAYLNTFGDGIENFLSDFAGIDLPTEFQDKEAIALFVNEHWDILLQALWTAMANDDLPTIKDALHDILDDENLREHIIPYLMADIGASFVSGLGFEFGINMNFSLTSFVDLNVADLVLTFDADPEGITFDGPFLSVTKGAATRIVSVGETVDFFITVHNYGSATAYDICVLDGMSSGLDGVREFYWTRDSLAAGATWNITFTVTATDGGLYQDLAAWCVYFNTTVASFDPDTAETWTGSALYTTSAPGYQILVTGGGGFWDNVPSEIFGIPTLYVAGGVGGVAVIGVALLVLRRR